MNKKYTLCSPEDTALALSNKLRNLRLQRKWKQATLAERSGVTLASLRRFEDRAEISLSNLLRLAFALDCLDEFDDLFLLPQATSLAELESNTLKNTAKRGRI